MIAGLPGRPDGTRARVLLVSMPFAGVVGPSLALGLLKAELERAGFGCDVLYLNVLFAQMVGWDTYTVVERCSALLAGERLFATDLFGDRIPSDREYDEGVLSRVEAGARLEVAHLRAHVPAFLTSAEQMVDWGAYDVVGFSSVFEQNLPSLALARRVKARHPSVRVVFGGANCEGVMGRTLHRLFPFVDYVCTGEGDHVLPELVRRVLEGRPVDGLRGIVHRRDGVSIDNGSAAKVTDLDRLPFPDFRDFYEIASAAGAPGAFDRQVAVETARGCWWGAKAQCTFCGLNGDGIAFRAKSPERAVAEIVHLAGTYGACYVRTVDNMMSPDYYDTFLPALAQANPGVDLFYEVRPTLAHEEIRALARARVTSVQAGIESLSTPILKIMRKGTSAVRNVEFLKRCREAGVFVDWNLLFGFPGERLQDYDDTLRLAELVTHLQAPACVGEIRLDRFSPNFESARALGFTNVRPWSLFRYVYPFDRDTLMDLVYYFDADRSEPFDDEGRLPRLRELVERWRRGGVDLVGRRQGRTLVIEDGRAIAPSPRVVLSGLDADAYEACDGRSTPAQVRAWIAAERGRRVAPARLQAALDRLVAAKLMVEEHGFYLALALLQASAVAMSLGAATAPDEVLAPA